ncbi:PREDICTED: inner centromere protein A-like [Amphimedon queenslandica]|uniref:Inner centromere protein ARK-binding domain-containing protein n=1 Tax=Amphimedon queenslandica TaxID=400682 RepID=A0A1X7SFM3_AMPQE|nr:PREDICTED: inner centromere protein A-like [Amphimedon queenslandica]|eukprot:XP_019864046.1 PREDICTED: inner centromere protein A-like [Amphimedon queenslandica]
MEMKEQIRLKKQLGKDEHKKPVVPAVTTCTTVSTASQSIPLATTCASHYTTPLNKCITTTTSTCASSYQITPMSQDPLLVADNNYDIAELSSDDSSDDEDCPKKTVPMWAAPMNLNRIISEQERTDHDIDSIFPPTDLLQSPNLGKIFGFSKRRFLKRTSSAQWTSPMLKKTRPLTENNNSS